MSKQEMHWAAAWGSAPSIARIAPARYGRHITLRYAVRMLFNGTKIRLRLSNLGGKEAVDISRIAVAKCEENGVLTGESIPVAFNGESACHMAAGGSAVSDPIALDIVRGEDVAVSMYLGEMTELATGTEISGPLSRLWFCEGEALTAVGLPPAQTMRLDTCFFLDTVDVWTSSASRALVCFGDSITAQAWPDELALRLLRDGGSLSVVRRGIGGSRIFRAYSNIQHRCYGPDGLSRFAREISVAGADRVIVLHGINDLMHPEGSLFRPWSDMPTAGQLVEGMRFYIQTAHTLGMKICLGTCVTFKGWPTYSPQREEIRHSFNEWIRSQREADGIADFDAALRDPADPNSRAPACDCGDHVHPSREGARRMAACVPEAFLRR